MVEITDKYPLVDLYTPCPELQDAMLSYYPERMFEKQCGFERISGGRKMFRFRYLFLPTLQEFLENFSDVPLNYQIKHSITRRTLVDAINKIRETK